MLKPSGFVLLLFILVIAGESLTTKQPETYEDVEMSWVIIGVVAFVALILAVVFGTYCCGGWCPDWCICWCKKKDVCDSQESDQLIPESKDQIENLLRVPKITETPASGTTGDLSDAMDSSLLLSTLPLPKPLQVPNSTEVTKLENFLE